MYTIKSIKYSIFSFDRYYIALITDYNSNHLIYKYNSPSFIYTLYQYTYPSNQFQTTKWVLVLPTGLALLNIHTHFLNICLLLILAIHLLLISIITCLLNMLVHQHTIIILLTLIKQIIELIHSGFLHTIIHVHQPS